MKFIKRSRTIQVEKKSRKLSIFLCPMCKKEVEKIHSLGGTMKCCSIKCRKKVFNSFPVEFRGAKEGNQRGAMELGTDYIENLKRAIL